MGSSGSNLFYSLILPIEFFVIVFISLRTVGGSLLWQSWIWALGRAVDMFVEVPFF